MGKKATRGSLHEKLCQYIVMVYFLAMTVVYPLYAPGGYPLIGKVKYEFFRNAGLSMLLAAAAVLLLTVLIQRDSGWIVRVYRRLSVTDWFVYGYLLAVLLSYLCSAYQEDALWGIDGWYMGVVTQVILAACYFLLSRYFHRDLRWLGAWLIAAAVVFALGICNRYSIYPIPMTGQGEDFISTLGNINWFCGYWSVTAPLGIALYWCSDKRAVRILAGIYSVIAMLAGVTQGSDSAYLVFAALLVLFWALSLRDHEKWYRFLELCMMFAGSCQLARLLRYLPGTEYNYRYMAAEDGSDMTMFLLDENGMLWTLGILLFLYILLRYLGSRGHFRLEKQKWIWGIAGGVLLLVLCFAAVLLLLDSELLVVRETPFTVEQDGGLILVFDKDWGNGRGAAWNCGIHAFRGLNGLHKIVGVGPDCFTDYVYSVPELAYGLLEQYGNQRLTNAHNEQLTLLVNVGVLGWACYMGIFITAFVRYLRRADRQPLLYLGAASLLAYTVHNMVSFQQVLNIPFMFIVLGIGERFCRAATPERNSSCPL